MVMSMFWHYFWVHYRLFPLGKNSICRKKSIPLKNGESKQEDTHVHDSYENSLTHDSILTIIITLFYRKIIILHFYLISKKKL